MRKQKRIKRSITLIELMVVVSLIGIIGGALAFNMKGSINKGKLFQTEQNCAKVYDILMMEYALSSDSLEDIVRNKQQIVKESAIGKDSSKLLKDAWGEELVVRVCNDGEDLEVYSKKARTLSKAQR
ncbi:type II secretion system protein [Chlamydiifrater phoenicopteri]|uniref:type II secretion system protein n=1 Tax=Chlamydiifrater phoenicopteri TaxID=2681469 RepID=UPI001BCD9284|nr:type II secretion system protein [Chlamydiifrater phoenicopteri]